MRFTETSIPGAWIVDVDPLTDERGFFARTVCVEEFEGRGLNGRIIQQSISWNPRPGTLRGLHYQAAPHAEQKLVRVTRGAIFDVIVDLRPHSPAFGRWFGIDLDEDNRRQLYVPHGVAHGFQTLRVDTEVLYEMTTRYHAAAACGLRWDDPELNIAWPSAPSCIGERDRSWPTWASLVTHTECKP